MSEKSIQKVYELNLEREKLFASWISPNSIVPPVSKIEVEPKVGGFLRLYVETPSGYSIMNGKFKVITPPSRLEYDWEWDNNGEITQIVVDFQKTNLGTQITIHHSGFHSEASLATHDFGWDSYIEGLIQCIKSSNLK